MLKCFAVKSYIINLYYSLKLEKVNGVFSMDISWYLF